ncbi:hypothetical protein COS86_04890 [Candidatus Bathyarchaeota archaeon CG07_land_8_20_14_0_80_47_9]|nr:MAG: hypothetical protein COS86_04890 [Candidatus Bathyarchaeota archaeon CG07_land_8_20_14_0_80_47_9]
MNFIEILLSEKLKDKNPMLDVLGSDRKVLQIACQDLTNYLKVHWDLVGKEANECELVEKLESFFNENPTELDEFLSIWTGIWLRKWKERVKLLIGNENTKRWNKVTKILDNAEPLWEKLSNRQEMQEVITSTLIKNGEICGTSILAENLLKMELGDEKSKEYVNEKEQVLSVMNNTLRKARELAQSKGPLIFVKVDKGYYQSTQ